MSRFLAVSLTFLSLVACASPCPGGCTEGAVCVPQTGVCRCGDAGGEVCDEGDLCYPAVRECVAPVPSPVCGGGTPWSPGSVAFEDATSDWGLDALGVQGVRLSVTDIDGDGWADLEVRRGTPRPDEFDGVRRTFLLRNVEGQRFEDVTLESGFLTRRLDDGRGRPVQIVAWGDVDNDGDLDAYSGLGTADPEASDGETSEILLNDGQGVFSLAAIDSPLRRPEDVDAPAGASFADVDRDGRLDLWVPQHNTSGSGRIFLQQDRLWAGDGTGSFRDATMEAGLETLDWTDLTGLNEGRGHTRAWSANACDLDGDGSPDLLASSYGRSPNHLWLNAGDGTFENQSVASGYAYDEDLTWEDNQFARCYCRDNPTADGCADVAAPTIRCATNWNHATDREPFRLGGNSGATLCGDLDNDGDLDLLTTEIRHWWAGAGSDGSEVLINDGSGRFSRPGDAALGLEIAHSGATWDEGHMTAALFDFDNDGRLDVYIGGSDYAGNRGLLYHQSSSLRFEEVPPAEGIDHNRSHGVVFADFDRDGDLDVVVGHSRARCDSAQPNDCYETAQVRLFRNVTGSEQSFLQVALEGTAGSNRSAIGARVRVTTSVGNQVQEVGGGHGHYGAQDDLVLHFGLGDACEAEVEVRWPDSAATIERHTLAAGHRYRLRQGSPPRPLP